MHRKVEEKTEKKQSMHSGHRSRLRERYLTEGTNNFSDINLLELLLFSTIPRGDTNPIAHRLIEKFGSLSSIFEAPQEELLKIEGVGPKTAEMLRMIPVLCRAYIKDKVLPERGVFKDNIAMYEYLMSRFIGYYEEMVMLMLTAPNGRMKYCGVIERGNFSSVAIDVRKIAALCEQCHCNRIVLAHNHPSGYAIPSREDIIITRALHKTLKSVGIELYDHLIVADGEYTSLREYDLLAENEEK